MKTKQRVNYHTLKRKLRALNRKKRSAPPYQKELIRREIIRTKTLLRDVYGEDTKKNSAFGGFLGLVLGVAFLIALPIITSDEVQRNRQDPNLL